MPAPDPDRPLPDAPAQPAGAPARLPFLPALGFAVTVLVIVFAVALFLRSAPSDAGAVATTTPGAPVSLTAVARGLAPSRAPSLPVTPELSGAPSPTTVVARNAPSRHPASTEARPAVARATPSRPAAISTTQTPPPVCGPDSPVHRYLVQQGLTPPC
jgi:hypothetical protein